MKLITCLVGNKYTEEMAQALDVDIIYRGNPRIPGVWNKLAMLDEFTDGEYFFIDVDTFRRAPLPKIEITDKLMIWSDTWKDIDDYPKHSYNTILNSSIMAWKGDHSYIWNHFHKNRDYYMRKYKGIDRFLYWEDIEYDIIPDGIVVSHSQPDDGSPLLTFNGEDYGQYFKSTNACVQ